MALALKPTAAQATAEIALAGMAATLDLSGALYLPEEDALVVADLHFEKGSSFARRGSDRHLLMVDTLLVSLELESVRRSAVEFTKLATKRYDGTARTDAKRSIFAACLGLLRLLAGIQNQPSGARPDNA